MSSQEAEVFFFQKGPKYPMWAEVVGAEVSKTFICSITNVLQVVSCCVVLADTAINSYLQYSTAQDDHLQS